MAVESIAVTVNSTVSVKSIVVGIQGAPGQTGSAGSNGAAGSPGADGADGSDGAAGAPGLDGAAWFHGEGAPAEEFGQDGDYYIDSLTGDFYQHGSSAGWNIAGNIRGPAGTSGTNGADGADGADGSNGTAILLGSGAPAEELGADGDAYVDVLTGDLYGHGGSVGWNYSGSLRGPQGATGPQGPAGSAAEAGVDIEQDGAVIKYKAQSLDFNAAQFTVTENSDGTVEVISNAITLTGDVTGSGTGSFAATLATVNGNVGTFGNATQAAQVTVNGKGLVTAVANVTITPAYGSITGLPAAIDAIDGLTPAADRLAYYTSASAAALATFTSAARNLLDDADASAMRTTLGLAIGTNVQAYDAELAALAGLTSAADKLPYFIGSGTADLADLTSAGRSLVAASTARLQSQLLNTSTFTSLSSVRNIATAPYDFADASWFNVGLTITALNGYDAAGNLKAVKLVETGTARHVFGIASLATTADVSHTLSVVVQPITGGGAATRYPIIYFTDSTYQSTIRIGIAFDLATLTYSAITTAGSPAPTGHDYGIETLPDGKYRIWFSATTGNADSSLGFFLGWATTHAVTAGVPPSYAGDDLSGFWISDFQIEANKKFPGQFGRGRTLDTLSKLTDPDADRLLFWDDSAGDILWLTAGTGLSISGTTITAGIDVLVDGTVVQSLAPGLEFRGSDFATSVNSDGSVNVSLKNPVSSFSGAMVKKSVDQTAANYTTIAAVDWDAESYDVGGWHDTVTNNSRITVLDSSISYIELGCTIAYAAITANEWVLVTIRKNGSATWDGNPSHQAQVNATNGFVTVSTGPIPVALNDYFQVFLQVMTDTSITITANRSVFWARAIQ